ncbi:MAG: hypothetical protein M0Z76_09990 [Gammaproteobacteria bacterium]|nr:hypothetical protein [Gammaproteobacteria bacterium]
MANAPRLPVPTYRPSLRRPAAFELTVAGTLVLVLMAVAVHRIWFLRAFAEQVAFQNTVGVLHDAIGMKIAYCMSRGHMVQLAAWAGRNPMRLLAVPPRNYVGVVKTFASRRIKPGTWYFDRTDRMLVYRPADAGGLQTPLRPKRIRWQLQVVFLRKGARERVTGLRLVPMPSYVWHAMGD